MQVVKQARCELLCVVLAVGGELRQGGPHSEKQALWGENRPLAAPCNAQCIADLHRQAAGDVRLVLLRSSANTRLLLR